MYLIGIHNVCMKDRHQVPPYPLRLPAELKNEIAKAAFVMGRSFNSEVVARLSASLDPDSVTHLPTAVADAVAHEIKERGGTPDEALTRLVLAGQAQGGTVVNISIAPGTTMAQVREMIEGASKLVPADASLFVERKA